MYFDYHLLYIIFLGSIVPELQRLTDALGGEALRNVLESFMEKRIT